MTRIGWTLLLATLLTFPTASGQIPDSDSIIPADHIELLIPANDGRIQWKEVAASLAQSLSLDVETVERMFPSGSIDARSHWIGLAVLGINLAGRDKLVVDVVRDDQNNRALRLRCDRRAFGIASPQKSHLATIQLDEDWAGRSTQRPVVICIHGLRSRPEVFDGLREFLRVEGFATAAVGYDDEQSIGDSAKQISQLVEEIFITQQAETPGPPQPPQLALVGHSMGGLIAREWAENDRLGGQRIISVITVATPHGGSSWASMPPLLDLVTSGDFDKVDVVDLILHQPSSAGLKDLAPGSRQLNRMNARRRRDDIRYTTIVGTGSPVSDSQAKKLSRVLQSIDKRSSLFRLVRPRIEPMLGGWDEIVRGKGDGVVAARHATIEGVADIVTFDLSHGEIIRPIVGSNHQPVWETILDRLK